MVLTLNGFLLPDVVSTITDNDSELGKQRNRRTQIIVTPRLDQFLELIDKAPEAEGEAATE